MTGKNARKTTDVIVIGSGIGGLSAASLLARYGFQVTVCESHTIPGGAAHGFKRQGYLFDSGPSLYSGLSTTSPNPLRQVLDAIDETVPCVNYDTWGCWLPEGNFNTAVGADQFCEVLQELRGNKAVTEWRQLQQVMAPLSQAAVALPPLAVRSDWRILRTMLPFVPSLTRQGPQMFQLMGAFHRVRDQVITDSFLRNWLDLLCYLLSGLPANGTSAAEMAFMFADWYRPNVQLDYPVGGSEALVKALVRGLEKYGGTLRLGATVEQILLDRNRAVGVRLKNGEELRSRYAVISNASAWDTLNLIPKYKIPGKFRQEKASLPLCPSFMHLHLGIDAADLPKNLPCHHIIVNDWEKGVTAQQNVVLVSIPSLVDPSLAPPGKHVIHAYTPASEPYELWEGMDRRSAAYQQQKEERSQVLWDAIARFIPDIRDRCEVTLIGTPLTHERFLRRYRGTYGPAISAEDGLFPGAQTPWKGLLCCGDSTFPGIGLPAVAASGAIAANTVASVQQHLQLLRDL
ncbi:MAG: phytoene desaturase family protein, partial [Halothece sp.]